MPVYEHYCDKCEREVKLTSSIREHEKKPVRGVSKPLVLRTSSLFARTATRGLSRMTGCSTVDQGAPAFRYSAG